MHSERKLELSRLAAEFLEAFATHLGNVEVAVSIDSDLMGNAEFQWTASLLAP
jgi:hypothetical protein